MEEEIIKYCESKGNIEAGGVIQAGFFTPLENISTDPENTFEFDLGDIDYSEIEAVVHSHPDGIPFLSDADRKSQVASGLDWWLVVDGEIHKFKCVPLLRGRNFIYGQHDCATLIEDAMAICGIEIAHLERGTLDSDSEIGKLEDSMPKLRFNKISEYVPGCVVLTSSGEEANHAVLYIGDYQVLHHSQGGLSKRAFFGEAFMRRTHSIWLHKDWKPEMIEAIQNDIRAYDL